MSAHILIIDDDRFLGSGIQRLLNVSGYEAHHVVTATEALTKINEKTPSLLILDLNLPDRDGVDVCREIRRNWTFPILMLTSRNENIDKVVGLESGADDYLTKPFDAHELLARVKAQLRRNKEYTKAEQSVDLIIGPLKIVPTERKVTVHEKPISLTETEYKIIEYLAANPGRAISREQIFESIWGFDISFSSNSLDVLMYRLRSKMGALGATNLIRTIRGYGYKLEPGPG